jgi:hypothetical protein
MIATWGGTTTRLAKRPPIIPKFDKVIVAPRNSSGGIARAAASARVIRCRRAVRSWPVLISATLASSRARASSLSFRSFCSRADERETTPLFRRWRCRQNRQSGYARARAESLEAAASLRGTLVVPKVSRFPSLFAPPDGLRRRARPAWVLTPVDLPPLNRQRVLPSSRLPPPARVLAALTIARRVFRSHRRVPVHPAIGETTGN